MLKQYQISKLLDIDNSYFNKIINKKLPIPWTLAEKLADLFPGKSLKEWKYASPEDIKQAFNQPNQAKKAV